MATKFSGGKVLLGSGSFSNEICVSDSGQVISTEAFYQREIQEFVELNGGILLPAFRDGHAHPLFAGREAKGLSISHCQTEAEILSALKEHNALNPELNWIDGAVYNNAIEATFTRQTLDGVLGHIPVVLHGNDHHSLWVNTKALEIAGILTRSKAFGDVAGIDRDEEGLATGILREWPAMRLVLDLAPEKTLEEDLECLVWADKALASAGLVEAYDAWIDPGMAETYLAAADQGLISLSYKLCFRADPVTFQQDLKYIKGMRSAINQRAQLDGNSIKFFVDGVFGNATAMVSVPYESNGSNGSPTWEESALKESIEQANAEGFQIHVHAIGDAALSLALSILEAIPRESLNYRPVLIHAELTTTDLIKRIKNLDAIACVQPYWAQYDGMLNSCRQHLGQERLSNLYSFREMLDNKVNLAFSSDWPVSTYEPLQAISVAVNRRSTEEQIRHNPNQAISLMEALQAYSNGVVAMRSTSTIQVLTIGSEFDAVILDKDIFTLEGLELNSAKVLATYKSGKQIF
jgi:predicted amidohydrolase YtcJ